MIKILKKFLRDAKKNYRKEPKLYVFLGVILVIAFVLRIYRLDQLLGFYYDQGRDALVIWNFWHEGRLFLIGPTTGIEGIYRGPWYYWLIAPFYLLGGGDPIWPSVFLAFTTVLAIGLLYYFALKIEGKLAGIIAVIIASFSYYLILSSRWLSNPTPMFLISMLFMLSLYYVSQGKKWAWVCVGFLWGMAMQFGSATEVFYAPAILVVGFLNRKNLPTIKLLLISVMVMIFSFVPQILFDLKHEGVLLTSIKRFLIEKESFKPSFWQMLQIRYPLYLSVFLSKIFPTYTSLWRPTLVLAFIPFLVYFRHFFQKKLFVIAFIVFVSPIIGMLFFQGNQGNVYDYYFTGYYLIFVLLVSVLFAKFARSPVGVVIVIALLYLFAKDNLILDKNYLISGVDGPTNISLGNQMQSVGWIFNNAEQKEFNQDSYVPPVIPYSYDYLFLWQATKKCGKNLCNLKLDSNMPLLYTLYEEDPPHPERLEAWLKRQQGIGKVLEEARFGGITVQKRERI